MRLSNRSLWMAGVVALAAGASQADASSLAITFANPTSANQLADNYGGTLGFQFTVPSNAPIYSVTAVGVYDNENLSTAQSSYGPPVDSTIDGTDDGLVSNHAIFIYDLTDSTTVPVATATVPSLTTGSVSTANFAMVSLTTPLPLIPTDTYEIAENIGGADGDFWLYSGSPTVTSDFSNITFGYGPSSGPPNKFRWLLYRPEL
jgi:hypothetical protein